MKDYYYFLGVEKGASQDEIRKAYRALSLKYHPDVNEGSEFFANRFREVQEAYEVLSNDEKRRKYDVSTGNTVKTERSDLPPYIKTFTADKTFVRKGDSITISWQTVNADLVKILPFGLEKSYGERTFKINEFQGGKFSVVLQATNTLTNKTVVKGITITEITDGFTGTFRHPAEEVFRRPTPRTVVYRTGGFGFSGCLTIILLILFFIMFFFFSY